MSSAAAASAAHTAAVSSGLSSSVVAEGVGAGAGAGAGVPPGGVMHRPVVHVRGNSLLPSVITPSAVPCRALRPHTPPLSTLT